MRNFSSIIFTSFNSANGFTMKVYPTPIALFGVSALCFYSFLRIEYLIQRMLVDIAKHHI